MRLLIGGATEGTASYAPKPRFCAVRPVYRCRGPAMGSSTARPPRAARSAAGAVILSKAKDLAPGAAEHLL